jgi:hypothetical protein
MAVWARDARLIEPRPVINPKVLELQTAKEIREEVFHARTDEVEEMIQRRLEKRRRFLDWSLRNAGISPYISSCPWGLRLQTHAYSSPIAL